MDEKNIIYEMTTSLRLYPSEVSGVQVRTGGSMNARPTPSPRGNGTWSWRWRTPGTVSWNCPFKKRKNLYLCGAHFSVELHHPFPQPWGSAAVASVSIITYCLPNFYYIVCEWNFFIIYNLDTSLSSYRGSHVCNISNVDPDPYLDQHGFASSWKGGSGSTSKRWAGFRSRSASAW